jgi:hypothetical protein
VIARLSCTYSFSFLFLILTQIVCVHIAGVCCAEHNFLSCGFVSTVHTYTENVFSAILFLECAFCLPCLLRAYSFVALPTIKYSIDRVLLPYICVCTHLYT